MKEDRGSRRARRRIGPRPHPGNAAAAISIADERSIVFTPSSGSLGSTTLLAPSDASPRLTSCQPFPDSYRQTPPVDFIVAASSPDASEPARLLFGGTSWLRFASLGPGRVLTVGDEIFTDGDVYSAAFSPVWSAEALSLGIGGVRGYCLDGAMREWDVVTGDDLWPLDVKHHYFKVAYAAHPRVAHLTSSSGLHRVDMRSGSAVVPQFNVRKDWRVGTRDGGVRASERHPAVPFWSVVASDHVLAVVDERMPKVPLLTWSLPAYVKGGSRLTCVETLGESGGDLFAMGGGGESALAVFHMHRGDQAESGFLPLAATSDAVLRNKSRQLDAGSDPDSDGSGIGMFDSMNINSQVASQGTGEKGLLRLPKTGFTPPPAIWSDMPLEHLQTFAPTERLCGMAFMLHPDATRQSLDSDFGSDSFEDEISLTLVQVSADGSAIGQRIVCGVFADGVHVFENAERWGHNSFPASTAPASNVAIDNFVALRDTHLSFGSARMRSELFDKPWRDFEICARMKRLHAVSALDLRRRLTSSDDDDIDAERDALFGGDVGSAAITFPRPHVADRPLIVRMRAEVASGERREYSSAGLDFLHLRWFFVVPRTLEEVGKMSRLSDPHARTVMGPSELAEKLDMSPHLASDALTQRYLSNGAKKQVYYCPLDGNENDNPLTKPVPDSPFDIQLKELKVIFYK